MSKFKAKYFPVRLFLLLMLCGFCKLLSGQIQCDGTIAEPEWGPPLGTSAGGPLPCFGAGFRLNSLFAAATSADIMLGVGGNVQNGNRILVFIDSKTGGVVNGNFSRINAPQGLDDFNANTKFDADFAPDYCLVVGADPVGGDYFFDLFSLSTATGTNRYLGAAKATATDLLGANPLDYDNTRGFEVGISRSILGYDANSQPMVKLMPMIISDGGFLDNQFITPAAAGSNCYGAGAIAFETAEPNPIAFNPNLLLPITFSDFRYAQQNKNLILFWQSATETNMQRYEVERSADAIVFTTISTTAAKGNTTTVSNYESIDAKPLVGKSFYRIKAIDKSGRSAYSRLIKVQYGYVDNTLGIYPNPVKDLINLQLVGLAKGRYSLVIFNDKGQRMIAKTIEHNGGYGTQQIAVLPGMVKGPYRLLLTNKSLFYKQSFIVE